MTKREQHPSSRWSRCPWPRDGGLFERTKNWNWYYVSGGRWFVCKARNKRIAKSAGVEEFGRGQVGEVRRATDAEVKRYLHQSGRTIDDPCLVEDK